MSIIAEALKKAQKGQSPNLSSYTKTPGQPILGPQPEYRKKGKKILAGKKSNFLIGGLVFGALLLFSLALVLGYIQNLQRIYIGRPVPAVSTNKTGVPLSLETVKPLKEKELFKLSGIVHDENKSLAVINDRIVASGEMIDGARVTDISDDSASLSYKGKKITLYLGE